MATDSVDIAVLAKAPEAGFAKTRLIPALGAQGAARLQRWLTRRAVDTAQRAGMGAVTLHCAPDAEHRFFRALAQHAKVSCRTQHAGDLGERMLHAFATHCPAGPLLVIGTDCPALQPDDLCIAARALREGHDAVVQPAEDGGYVLIGLREPLPDLFAGIPWGTDSVMEQTRARMRARGATWCEPRSLWDVDRPADLPRLRSFCRDDASLRTVLAGWRPAGSAPGIDRASGGSPCTTIAADIRQ